MAFLLLALFAAGAGMLLTPRIHAAFLTYIHPPDKSILVNRHFEPNDFSAASSGDTITVTIDVTNHEGDDLRGFYYSDQVPNGWAVATTSISVDGSAIADYTYRQGYANEIYSNFTPHRWALELPQGEAVFSPTHPIAAGGGTARIVYTMIVSDDTQVNYSLGHDAWAGWLTTAPVGTAAFGYQACYWADVVCDCQVNVADVQAVASAWRCAAEDDCYDKSCDVDGDGVVAIADIMQVAAEWGWSCP